MQPNRPRSLLKSAEKNYERDRKNNNPYIIAHSDLSLSVDSPDRRWFD